MPAALNGIVGLKPSLGALSASGVVPACRTLDTISIFALDVGDAFAAFRAACGFDESDAYSRPFAAPALSAVPPGLRFGAPRESQRKFFGDQESEAAFSRDLRALESLGARIVEFDFEPFAEVARLLYEGPWVAERYAATKTLIESHPEAFHPVTRAIIEGARKFDAVSAFEAFYRLADLKRRTKGVWSDFDVMVVPTAPRLYTVAEVEADPVPLNSRLGTYTNFVNLLDLSAIAAPSGMRGDGLPSSVTLIGPSGADGLLAGVAQAVQSRAGAPMGATKRLPPSPPPAPALPTGGRIEIMVVGAHLSGLPLNRELTELGGSFLREVETTGDYRLFALPGTAPAKPGLLRVADGAGAPIKAEVWTLDPAAFGAFVARIPAPLGIGNVRLADGGSVKGFLVEVGSGQGGRRRLALWRLARLSQAAVIAQSRHRERTRSDPGIVTRRCRPLIASSLRSSQ